METELRKNQIEETEITGFSSTGDGVCHIGGRAVFVPRVLPGERWQVRIVKVTKTAVWGRGEKLITPSTGRREPICPAYGKCGGCATMHMDYATELSFKLGRVNDALQHIGGLPLRADRILGAEEEYGYRNKAIYNLAPGPVCGFYRARSHDVIQAKECFLQPVCFHRAAAALVQWMQTQGTDAYDERQDSGSVRHLFLRKTSQDFSACIVSAESVDSSVVSALLAACPELTGVMACRNNHPGNVVLNGDIRLLWGRDTVEETLCGARFLLSPLTFFQVNTAQAERLYTLAGEYAEPAGKTILDLYCGAGTIGLSAARDAKLLIGNDITPSAIENARHNADLNGVSQAEYFCGDAGNISRQLAADGLHPDVIIADPPRKGLNEEVLSALTEMNPERIVYVSCDPGTLARDLKRLTERGFEARQCTAVDMFPKTRHVETVCLLCRENMK